MTKKLYKINHAFNCDSKCLIYLFSGKVCGIQYVGSTVDEVRLIASHDDLMNDCEIIFIDQTDSSDPTRREFLWMRVLKTIAPFRLNIDEGYAY